MVDAERELEIKCCKFIKDKTLCTHSIRDGFSEEVAFALGLEIVVKLRNRGRTFQAGEVSKNRQRGRRGFVQGTVNSPIWPPGSMRQR